MRQVKLINNNRRTFLPRIFGLAAGFGLLWAFPAFLAADTIYLNNGRQIQGRIIGRSDSQLKVDVYSGGVLNLSAEDVRRVESHSPTQTRLDRINSLMQAGLYEKSLALIDEALAENSKDATLAQLRETALDKYVEQVAKQARTLATTGKFYDIANVAGPALKKMPDGPAREKSMQWFTRLYLEKAAQDVDHIRYTDAAKTLAQAVDIGINDPRVHLWIGNIHERQGRLTLAGNEYQMAVLMDGNLREAVDGLERAKRAITRLGLERVDPVDKTKEMVALSATIEKKVRESFAPKTPSVFSKPVVPTQMPRAVFINDTEFQQIARYIPKTCDRFDDIIDRASIKYRVEKAWIKAIIMQESSFDPRDVSPVGAKGLMQLMDQTARLLGVGDSYDPEQNIMGGTHYFRDMLDQFGQDPILALAAYNAGPGAVTIYKGVPPYKETQGYVRRVPMYYQYFKFSEQGRKIAQQAGK